MNDEDMRSDCHIEEVRQGEESRNGDDEVQVLEEAPPTTIAKSSSEDRREQRRRRRRRLRRIIKKANGFPSFVGLLQANLDVSDDEDEEEEDRQPKRIRIDVDAELGLKDPNPVEVKSEREASHDVPRNIAVTPEEEGYYEGIVSPMFLAEDAQYLSPLQQWVRKNLEFFSATDQDAAISQAGRRTPTVRGKVGIRCIHCAKAAASMLEGPESVASSQPVAANKIWPAGAISYPVNIAGISSVCSQKPQLHFEHCPNLPDDVKSHFRRLGQDASANVKRIRRSGGGISTALYYTISAKRVGLIDVKDGIRFGRDLSLEPLPFETVRMQTVDEMDSSSRGDSMAAARTTEPRITADEESERVLAEAVAEKDDPSRLLARSEDKAKVSDCIFLTIRQMAICHAVPSDFSTRGKKTKLMRIGFAGFCCRHCMEPGGAPPFVGDFACRSFSSAADNLSSAISNSFTNHLQKCYKVPSQIKKALSAYKKIHQKQIAQLPYGSQRRLFHELWSRLRSCDKSEDEMQELIKSIPELVPSFHSARETTGKASEDETLTTGTSLKASEAQENESSVRSASFPVCEDADTQAILSAAEDNWDSSSNDNLLLPKDRNLISDYVFLTMRQLRVAIPDAVEAQRGRRASSSALPGICCIHCHKKDVSVSPSGRSFPSAPDNFASALNSSLFTHMQNCPYLPADLKKALSATRKIHSKQCSSLRFGSQRRFFNLLFDRLRQFRRENKDAWDNPIAPSTVSKKGPQDKFEDFGFINIPTGEHSCQMAICRYCRMVPFQFRARGSVIYDKADIGLAKEHNLICKKDGFDFGLVSCVLEKALQSIGLTREDVKSRDSLKALAKEAVNGNEELARLFSEDILNFLQYQKDNQRIPGINDEIVQRSKGLWKALPTSVNDTRVEQAFAAFATDVLGASSELRDHPTFAHFLLLISPTLIVDSSPNGSVPEMSVLMDVRKDES